MGVYLKTPVTPSRALDRVEAALRRSPGVSYVETEAAAQVVIFPVVGRLEHIHRQVQAITARGQSYAIIQYVLRSSKRPDTADWISLWKGAKVVWSYYDLPALCREDGIKPKFAFYHAPLGVEPVFRLDHSLTNEYVCGTFARHWLTESAREVALAAFAVNREAWHVGDRIRYHQAVLQSSGMNDSQLANLYARTEFVPGLRRIEGFELPAAEGLLCGACPILFDRPHYRHWYDDLGGVFIPEGDRADVVKSLTKVFKKGAKPVTSKQRKLAQLRFGWDGILKGFLQAVLR